LVTTYSNWVPISADLPALDSGETHRVSLISHFTFSENVVVHNCFKLETHIKKTYKEQDSLGKRQWPSTDEMKTGVEVCPRVKINVKVRFKNNLRSIPG